MAYLGTKEVQSFNIDLITFMNYSFSKKKSSKLNDVQVE